MLKILRGEEEARRGQEKFLVRMDAFFAAS